MANAPTPAQKLQAQIQQNLAIRQMLVKQCQDAWQSIFAQTFTGGPGTVINIPARNVGLIKRFIVEVAATVSGTNSGPTHTLSTLGTANFFSQIVLTDLSNQTRINTTGWHLTAVASAKARQPYGSAITSTDTPFGYGNNFTKTQTAPATITAAVASNNVFAMFEVPVAYSDTDLRGAIYANVVNATFQLQLTVNPNLFAISTTSDAIFAMYQSSNTVAATLPSFTVTVYQNYLDQVPIGNNGPILPYFDIGTSYLLNNTSYSGLPANTDFPMPYANFRDFMSTYVVYDNAGVLTTNGTDINYFGISTANYTYVVKIDVNIISLWARLRLQDDFPKGTYYFDHRNRPISTVQYGNISLNANLATVTSASSTLNVGYEMLALQNQVTQAGSLAGS